MERGWVTTEQRRREAGALTICVFHYIDLDACVKSTKPAHENEVIRFDKIVDIQSHTRQKFLLFGTRRCRTSLSHFPLVISNVRTA